MSDLLSAIRPEIAAVPESGIVEVFNYGRNKPGLIPLWIGEGHEPTPAFIGEAAMQALKAGQTFYTYQRGVPPLREALAGYLTRTYGTPISHERIYVTIGGMQAIMEAVQLVLGPGDEIVVPGPIWPNIAAAVQIVGAKSVYAPIAFGNRGWHLDIERVMAACGPRTKAIFVNSPGNPTGWVMTREEQRALLDFARRRGLWILADEVYGRFTWRAGETVAPSFLQIADADERVIVLNTFSKNWAMTGWRIGWIVASPKLGQMFENLVQYNTSGVPTFLQYGAAVAAAQGDAFLAETVARCRRGRDMVTETFARLPRLRYAAPEGAFYAFFGVAGETDSRALAFKFVDQANVGLAPGNAFAGPGGQGYLRLCFAGNQDKLAEGLKRIAAMLG